MGYNQSWKWKTALADASRFTAWSHDIAHLQMYMATPGKLLPWEVFVWIIKLESGGFELVRQPPAHVTFGMIQGRATILVSEPQPFPPVVIRAPDGIGEPIFTPTEVAFNGDESANDACEPFQITFEHLQAPYEGDCKTNQCSYDILVRCALVRLAHYFPAVRVYSNGGELSIETAVEIWAIRQSAWKHVTAYNIQNPANHVECARDTRPSLATTFTCLV